MPLHRDILNEIERSIIYLVESGLADDQNFSHESNVGSGIVLVHYSQAASFGAMLRNEPYAASYRTMVEERSYSVRMLDGALIQMTYEFSDNGASLRRHRLAFLPAPDLLEFQNNPDLYLEDVLYADVIDKRVVTVPLRCDYDDRKGVAAPVSHPAAHLTLGQYGACRIALTAPLTPYLFCELLLRSFYNTAVANVSGSLPSSGLRLAETIHAAERALVHIGVPLTA